MIQELKENPIIKETELQNKFLKIFSITLCVTILLMLGLYFPMQHIFLTESHETIELQVKDIALNLVQTLDKEEPNAKMSEEFNIVLAKEQHNILKNPFVKDASLSIYDLSRKNIIAKSFEIPMIESESAIDWWKEKTMIEDGTPKISLNNEMMEFIKEYEKRGVYIAEMYELNTVLVPTKLVVLDKSGNEIKKCETHVPIAYEHQLYKEPVKIYLNGNRISDPIYSIMSEYEFTTDEVAESNTVIDETATDENIETLDGNGIESIRQKQENVELNYKKEFPEKISIKSENFTVNDNDYQIDYVYELNFWHGAWGWILVAELFCIIASAAIAYKIAKKEKRD